MSVTQHAWGPIPICAGAEPSGKPRGSISLTRRHDRGIFPNMVRVLLPASLVVLLFGGCTARVLLATSPVEGAVHLGETAAVDGPNVRPEAVIEDSRCPLDVECIQAGRLVVRATVLGGGWSKQMDLTLGVPVPVADGMLTLVDATPVPVTTETTAAAARFTFKFQGGR